MAIIHPEGWRELKASGAAQREIETLALLAYGLARQHARTRDELRRLGVVPH